jgi:outer membrane protein with beta-barrel domain
MKRIITLFVLLCAGLIGFAQEDTTGKNAPDTIKVGGMIIIRKHDGSNEIIKKRDNEGHYDIEVPHRHGYDKESNFSTNWGIIDIGFSNWTDKSDYAAAQSAGFVGQGVNDESMKLRTGPSRNVNLWLFMQKFNLVKHIVNLKYGLGIEMNNYFFDDHKIHFLENPTKIILDTNFAGVDKNKLAADYLTVPVMLNFNFTPGRGRGFGLSVGMSAGLLYSARQKIKENGEKHKTHDDYSLETWKISYVAELLLGPVKFYGSYATKTMFEKHLDVTPYTVGFRFSNW